MVDNNSQSFQHKIIKHPITITEILKLCVTNFNNDYIFHEYAHFIRDAGFNRFITTSFKHTS